MNNCKMKDCVTTRYVFNDFYVVYTNSQHVLDRFKAEYKSSPVKSGYYHRCTNTIVCNDLCNFSDGTQFLNWQSHNQAHR